jgi:hypothetical protein
MNDGVTIVQDGVQEKKEEKDEARDEARDKLVVNAEPLKKIVGS